MYKSQYLVCKSTIIFTKIYQRRGTWIFKKNSKNSFAVSIGNNVWIGNNVVITSGVDVGDGAVIGAGSVVTKNLEPFSINVGTPTKKVKYRFGKKARDYLKKIKWWNWNIKKIERNKKFFNINLSKSNFKKYIIK